MSSRVGRRSKGFEGLIRCVCALVFLALGSPALAGGAENESLSIESITAHFYYHGTSTFGQEDIASGKLPLRNSIIGEGAAEHPSSTTLVMVSLSRCSSCPEARSLEFTAVDAEGKKLTETSVLLSSYFSQRTRITIPFLLYGTGCTSVEVRAAVVGVDGARSESTAALPFACGE
jgi:hypothetical protein